jgi:hypothetical protein
MGILVIASTDEKLDDSDFDACWYRHVGHRNAATPFLGSQRQT